MSSPTDAPPSPRFVASVGDINEVRSRHPQRISELLASRRRRALFGADGKLMIVGCDHPARGALGAGGNATAKERARLPLAEDGGVDGLLRGGRQWKRRNEGVDRDS